ncbi:hypothetical protein NDA01_19625 [Trichocoleus desertorum AS-A10]|uniref:hypothetical protein n=1 Tax=Trichocoleus desertorum TaxID=1481672 RepID=UPI0032998C81
MDKPSSRNGLGKIFSPKLGVDLGYPAFLQNKILVIDFSLLDSPTASYPVAIPLRGKWPFLHKSLQTSKTARVRFYKKRSLLLLPSRTIAYLLKLEFTLAWIRLPLTALHQIGTNLLVPLCISARYD